MSRRRRRESPGDPGHQDPGRARGFGLVLLLAAALAAVQIMVLLVVFIPAPHNGGDNAAYVALARALLEGGYTEIWDPAAPPHTKYPPVFPALLAIPVALGATTWGMLKAVPLVGTVLFVVAVHLWVSERRGPLFGVAVALLVGLSPAVVDVGRWILSEPPFLALTFLALWAVDRAGLRLPALGGGSGEAEGDRSGPSSAPPTAPPARPGLWLAVGGAATVLAYLTRSAGLPLLLAVGVALLAARRWKALGAYTLGAGIPGALWWLRARSVGTVQYAREFWMVDPYRPELGEVGVGGLGVRAVENAQAYVLRYIPEALVGPVGGVASLLGVLLLGSALAGWALRVRRGAGVAEILLPLYAGVILLWPPVWSGDRFALPLLPLLLFWSGLAVVEGVARWSRIGARVAAGVAFVALLLPAMGAWVEEMEPARACAAATRAGGDYACWGPRWTEFVEAARWSGEHLPEGAAVLSRKPRIFFAQSGVPSRTFPFTADPEAFLDEAQAAGTGYVLLDYVDAQALRYVAEVVRTRPGLFCSVRAFSVPGSGTRTQLLGLVPDRPGAGGSLTTAPDGSPSVALPPCPPDLRPPGAADADAPNWPLGVVPILAGAWDQSSTTSSTYTSTSSSTAP